MLEQPFEEPPKRGNPDPALLHGVDAVVHLAGAPIVGRFTPGHKHAIRAQEPELERLYETLADATVALA